VKRRAEIPHLAISMRQFGCGFRVSTLLLNRDLRVRTRRGAATSIISAPGPSGPTFASARTPAHKPRRPSSSTASATPPVQSLKIATREDRHPGRSPPGKIITVCRSIFSLRSAEDASVQVSLVASVTLTIFVPPGVVRTAWFLPRLPISITLAGAARHRTNPYFRKTALAPAAAKGHHISNAGPREANATSQSPRNLPYCPRTF